MNAGRAENEADRLEWDASLATMPSPRSTRQGWPFSMPSRVASKPKTLAGHHEMKQVDEDKMGRLASGSFVRMNSLPARTTPLTSPARYLTCHHAHIEIGIRAARAQTASRVRPTASTRCS